MGMYEVRAVGEDCREEPRERKRGSFNLYLEQSTNCRRNKQQQMCQTSKDEQTLALGTTETLNEWYTTRCPEYPEYLVQTIGFG